MSRPRTVVLVSVDGSSVTIDSSGHAVRLSPGVLAAQERFLRIARESKRPMEPLPFFSASAVGGRWDLAPLVAMKVLAELGGSEEVRSNYLRSECASEDEWLDTHLRNIGVRVSREYAVRWGVQSPHNELTLLFAGLAEAEEILDLSGIEESEALVARLREQGFVELIRP